MRLRFVKFITLFSSLVLASNAYAELGNTITLLVGFPAGGAPDSVARVFANQLKNFTDANIIVENRPGASGKIAIDSLLAGSKNGQTVAIIPTSTLHLIPLVMKNAHYDSVKDFTTLGNLAEFGFGIAAGPLSKTNTLKDFKTWALKNPTQASFASPGQGTPQAFLGTDLGKSLNIDWVHIPYRGGAPAMTDLLGGQVPLLITTEPLLIPRHEKNNLNILFVTSKQRHPNTPSVPTAKEVGLPQLELQDWFGLFAHADTPTSIVNKWQHLTQQVVDSPDYQQALSNLYFLAPEQQLEDYTLLLNSERKGWEKRVKDANFTPLDQ